ncbi:MAG: Lrp/AsnC family transcriptional regulator [Desulfurococcales archaeon]|nr:Lrp/AsnC family transcriptional regulator [Desulfurococcales archaeon]
MTVNVLSRLDKQLLMGLQYEFPRTSSPIVDIAKKLGIEPNVALDRLKELNRLGVLKRIGFYVNYRSTGLKAALLAYQTNGKYDEIAEYYRRDKYATHVYLRDHPKYDLWIVTKRKTLEELVQHAKTISKKYNIEGLVLYSRRTYKLSVKYDLENGISRSGPYSMIKTSPPHPTEFGVEPGYLKLLRKLELSKTPYQKFAKAMGIGQDEAASLAWKMLDAGILGDPGAALDGHKIGFHENAMVVLEPLEGREDELCKCASSLPFTTHVVLRASIPQGAWKHTCYFMVHAVNRILLSNAIEQAISQCPVKSHLVIRSLADLKPGVVR